MTDQVKAVIARILQDIRVELSDEFDRNFERQGFFSEAWERRKSPLRPGGSILIDSGTLRRSIQSKTTETSITFYSDLAYAGIHNDGGAIRVTEKMKRYFWYRYKKATGSFGRTKRGAKRKDKRTIQLTDEAEFWKHMALMKVGRTIMIPRRRFLGTSPEVEAAVREIVEENLTEFFNVEWKIRGK
ncbi:MAG: phage virion morphogenesis protein [Bacteroides heparinolyticus]|nr:phage virion morphogenesis protein [Bacteroides heparinolyticus]